jgi:RNA polymerase sigma-70 factor (ECF subfamily)
MALLPEKEMVLSMAVPALASSCVDVAAARVAELHELYGDAVYRYCRKRLRSHEDAEDAAQIVFLNVHRALAQGVEPRSDTAWLFKIAENVVLYRRRTAVRRSRLEFPADSEIFQEVSESRDVELPGAARELAEALAKVPATQQRAYVLREWQGLPYQAIAAELDVSVEAATALVVRARNNLSRQLERPSAVRRGLGTVGTWLLAPLEKLASGGLAIKTAAGVATVVGVGIPATSALQSHPGGVASAAPLHRTAAAPARARSRAAAVAGGRFTSFLSPASTRPSRAAVGAPHRAAYAPDTSDPWAAATPDSAALAEPAPMNDATPSAGGPVQGDEAPVAAPVELPPAAGVKAATPGTASSGSDAGSSAAGDTSQPPPDRHGNRVPPARPTLPPKAQGDPAPDPGKSAIPHPGDDTPAS